ncbi:DUF3592 domain-containing protein [Zobellia uliginosa]|uniref:DUF3592 domain-containing protein n=1 Tax=Zobellia uliginosa TaxID=143224 RepID=UPI0026E21145|nr:DUF3592 domain-containing protein [Zobellia uliginosa]MDO6519016.1 DUF3592 domain-containing protein [Zobellia uliginosa]
MKSILLSVLFLVSPFLLMAQEATENWVETEATILEVHNKVKAKSTRAFAMVSFTANDGNQYETQVELLAIPIFGTTKAVNDKITILYNPETPQLAKTPSKSFIESYAMYLLIGAGIIFSFFNLKKAWAKRQ